MKNNKYAVGTMVMYKICGMVYCGTIAAVPVKGAYYTIIDDHASMELFRAGHSIGTLVAEAQILQPVYEFEF